MKIKMITAYDKNKLIGSNNKLPWKLPEDLQHFKKETLNKIIVMGKNTYLSLGKPLPDRINAVISSTLENTFEYENLIIFKSINDLLEFYKKEEEIIIIGGSSIYSQFLKHTNELIVTEIHGEYKGDAHFPDFSEFDFSIDMTKSFFNLESKSGVQYDIIYYNK
jgi:dihydrofolate reductase